MNKSEIKKDKLIQIIGARVHNLKNINVDIPQNKLTVITGLSGSGKSSLAFDTIYAEGQRRYMETFSAYARHFIGNMERPDVDSISGLSPVIAIEQKTTVKNPRSTVGTVTEIYDYLRLLFARASIAYSHVTGEQMIKYSDEEIANIILSEYADKPIYILAPVVDARKGHYKELFENFRKKGFLNARIDNTIQEITYNLKLDRYKTHNIEIVIDKLIVKETDKKRLKKSIDLAMSIGKANILIVEKDVEKPRYFSRNLMCPTSGLSYKEPAPYTFSFNSPQGACPKCNGLGVVIDIDISKIIPDQSLSIHDGGIVSLGKYKNTLNFWILDALAERLDFSLKTPIKELPENILDAVLYGFSENLQLKNTPLGENSNYLVNYDGVINEIKAKQDEESDKNPTPGKSTSKFNKYITCPKCKGTRLNEEALNFRFAGKNIAELSALDIRKLYKFLDTSLEKLSDRDRQIATEIVKEAKVRLSFLLDVGLDYLSLNLSAKSLSGGESQRIRLATQIGSRLVNVLYILDEPSIGLHQRDNEKLIKTLQLLRDRGNTVIVVEHDLDMILNADYVIDIGPGAGRKGGELVFSGVPEEMKKSNTITSQYISGQKFIPIPDKRRVSEKKITINGAKGNNLKNISIDIPLGILVCVTGVSGSGKSTLINETLVPILSQSLYNSNKYPLEYDSIQGVKNIDKCVEVDQSPIGRTPRSNPATYTGLFTDIRDLFASLPDSKVRGYKSGRFSFNVSGGRCETCKGAGVRTIEMNFLPDVYIQCETCAGRRYNRETLEVKFKGKSIADVLNLTINAAVDFFENIPQIHRKLVVLQQVGLGYVTLGQSSTTLSGGESQRIKLATELMRRDTGKTLYILDEPTTGLHFEDIKILLDVLNSLVNKGNSMIIIEHNLDIIKSADWIIDLGPEGGERGGTITFEGLPEELAKTKNNYTGHYLKEIL
ncbi:excinuclease ABC subunit UvrA [Bacteroidales bacterium OttesenSCG-928-I21]|nr:excinuclease ABC subunit UvrA [Bacteroidales bacterium OttesenSCG-928-I21]